jgi:diguanylate cyclase (GGDEF)-like protein
VPRFVWIVVLCVLWWPGVGCAQALKLARFAEDLPGAEVAEGRHDGRFHEVARSSILELERDKATWWRVTFDEPVAADTEQRLVLESPYLTRVEAWVPGRAQPTRHAIYGADADSRYSTRALVIPLPSGVRAGGAVYLRLERAVSAPVAVRVQSRDEVHRADLFHVAWRSSILSVLIVLGSIAIGFWIGVGDRMYAYFGAIQFGAFGYQIGIGGEARAWPVLADIFGASPAVANLCALFALGFSNLFIRRFLMLGDHGPWLDRALLSCTVGAGLAALAMPFMTVSLFGNLVLVASALVVLTAAVKLAWGGHRSGRLLLLGWLPLIVACVFRGLELSGAWQGAAWTPHALAASYSLTALLLTVALADRVQQIRQERDDSDRRASTDALTGVLSRPALDERLQVEMGLAESSGRPLSVIFFDVDHFKRINDRHGHQVGDRCLRIVALRARNRLRSQDSIGRYGGDEMLVLLPDTRLPEARAVAESLCATVNCRPLSMDDVLLDATLSLGVAEYQPGEETGALIDRADSALYASKAAGRNSVSVTPMPKFLPDDKEPLPT